MTLKLKTAATVQPILLADVKSNSRVDISDDDTLIGTMIDASVDYFERISGRALCTQTWQLVLDAFPTCRNKIEIAKAPVQSISSITYVDINGATQTFNSANYIVDIQDQCAVIALAYGVNWPATRDQINTVTVEFVAGYGAAAAVPAGIKRALLYLAGHFYDNREAVVVDNRIAVDVVPLTFDALVAPYKLMRFV